MDAISGQRTWRSTSGSWMPIFNALSLGAFTAMLKWWRENWSEREDLKLRPSQPHKRRYSTAHS
jgi:hypothetical protein